MPVVYILRCADNSYYVGHTHELTARVAKHQDGSASTYTAARRPVVLVYADECGTLAAARARERQIKGWTRAKKHEHTQQERYSSSPRQDPVARRSERKSNESGRVRPLNLMVCEILQGPRPMRRPPGYSVNCEVSRSSRAVALNSPRRRRTTTGSSASEAARCGRRSTASSPRSACSGDTLFFTPTATLTRSRRY